jgi:hypothetical protein
MLRDTRTCVGLDSLAFINHGLQIKENEMSKKQDLENFDRFMEFIKQNSDVKEMLLNALEQAKNNQPKQQGETK